ncbi:NTP transferase domain-containing protein [bacterium]|nr:NTP transferase domain-containing protein [bacterium]
MVAVILAGGQGTRLHPYTTVLPKPLVPIGEQPIIEILLRHLHKCGVTKVVIAVNHLAHLITAVLGDGSRFGLEIEYSLEDSPLSTVGPLRLISNLPENFIVVNGDVLTDIDISALYERHTHSKAMVTVAAARRAEKIDFGVLELADNHRVTGFSEKPAYEFVVSMGVYVFSRKVLAFIPPDKQYGFDTLMHDLLQRGEPVESFVYDGYWLDIGRLSDFERAQQDIERLKRLGLS